MFIDEIDYKTRMMAMLETPTEIDRAYQLCEDVFVQYGVNVWGIDSSFLPYEIANLAIDKTEAYFRQLKIPATLREIGIKDQSMFEIMAEKAVRGGLAKAYHQLDKQDVVKILEAAF